MFVRIFKFKFLPPGRGLWAMGTSLTDKGLYSALNNCAFVSTHNTHPSRPFCFLMDSQMLGIGTGFDTRGAGKIHVFKPKLSEEEFIIPDSREGWVTSVEMLLDSFFYPHRSLPKF